MTWKGVEKKMNWVNREMFHPMMENQEDERWRVAVTKWNDAYEALEELERLVKEYWADAE